MRLKAKNIVVVITLVLAAGAVLSPVLAQQDRVKQHPSAKHEPQAQILTADVDRSYQDGNPKNSVVLTGKSKIGIKEVDVLLERAGGTTFTVHLTTDKFTQEQADHLVVRVKNKIFVPHAYAGKDPVYWSLQLNDVDQASAEILYGAPLPQWPKESVTVKYTPHQKPYPVNGPVEVGITLTYVGKAPLTFYWGATGGGNYRARDTQLSFTATLRGAKAPANPKPLPDGFIMSPFVARPGATLKRSVDLAEWLRFEKPGIYLIDATYTLVVANPKKDALPSQWKESYHDQFSIEIGE